MDTFSRAMQAAEQRWGENWRPTNWASAPGRIELLGNHVDYNGGRVIAAAIDKRTLALVQRRPSGAGFVEAVFADLDGTEQRVLSLEMLREWRVEEPRAPQPLDYLRGVCAVALARDAAPLGGIRVVVAGDVPIGFGVSSSAALCLAMTAAIHTDNPCGKDLVLRAQEAEHRAGAPCGTMDQSAAVAGYAILYDAATMDFERLQPDLGDLTFALIDSGVLRSLATSSYPRRVAECQLLGEIARKIIDANLSNLAALNAEQFSRLAPHLDPELRKRGSHIISEVLRVDEGVKALLAGDWPAFGHLMTASGRSSALDYEISHPKVEEIVAAALEMPEVLGARMMGGGEGGAVLVLMQRHQAAALQEFVSRRLRQELNINEAVRLSQVAFGPGLARGVLPAEGSLDPVC